INFMGENPLRGLPLAGLTRFVDLTRVYDQDLQGLLMRAARECGHRLRKGVYLALSGPTYETPAEIRAFQRLGADAVGMSTVPEVIAMSHMNIPVVGISCITNMAAGVLKQKLHHQEVMDTAKRVEKDFTEL